MIEYVAVLAPERVAGAVIRLWERGAHVAGITDPDGVNGGALSWKAECDLTFEAVLQPLAP